LQKISRTDEGIKADGVISPPFRIAFIDAFYFLELRDLFSSLFIKYRS
jgi:hypothetical protein